MNLEPDPGPEQTSELLPAELLDLTFLDLFVLAKSGEEGVSHGKFIRGESWA